MRVYGRPDAVFYTDGSVNGGDEHGGSAVVRIRGIPTTMIIGASAVRGMRDRAVCTLEVRLLAISDLH